MDETAGITIRLLRSGDEEVVRRLAGNEGGGDPDGLLADPRTLMLAAFAHAEPVGFVLAHELPRRHGEPSKLFVYEIGVEERHRRRGVATALLDQLGELARERGIHTGFLLTEPDNDAANALYRSLGGAEEANVLWTFAYGDG